jgi:hypothetical protein
MKTFLAVLVLAAALCTAVFSSETPASPQPASPEQAATAPAKPEPAAPAWTPPKPPAHAQRSLETASDLARDLQEVASYLEAGQSYYRAYRKGTHTVEDNKAFLQFLESYEKEQSIARKETDALRKWAHEGTSLEAAAQP